MKSAVYTFLSFALLNLCSAFVVPSHSADLPAPWRRFTNRLIALIWGPQDTLRDSIDGTEQQSTVHRLLQSAAPQLGRDIVVRFNVSTADDASALAAAADNLFLDVWEFTSHWVDVRLRADALPSLLDILPGSLQRSHALLMTEQGLAKAVAETFPSHSARTSTPPVSLQRPLSPSLRGTSRNTHEGTNIFFQDYQPLSVIVPWMRLLASMFPTHVRLINIGYTFEGREIPAFRVGVHPTNRDEPDPPRRTVVVMGGTHAREWISTSSVTFLAYNFITEYGKSMMATTLLQAFDWVFIPTINPDGYVYSWNTDRLWRKNRQTTPLQYCRGIDLDRSWGFEWDGNSTKENPCSEGYAGAQAFEGVEAERLALWAQNETENNAVEFVSFIDLHAYSQQVLYPYSFSCRQAPPTLENLEELGLGLAKAMRMAQGGRYYKANSACEGNVAADGSITPRIETGGGSAIDWFYHELRVKYAYQIKLRDTGSYGFLLPKENIIPTGKEVVNALLYLGKYMMGEVGFRAKEVELTKPTEPLPTSPPTTFIGPAPSGMDVSAPGSEDAADEEGDKYKGVQWELKR